MFEKILRILKFIQKNSVTDFPLGSLVDTVITETGCTREEVLTVLTFGTFREEVCMEGTCQVHGTEDLWDTTMWAWEEDIQKIEEAFEKRRKTVQRCLDNGTPIFRDILRLTNWESQEDGDDLITWTPFKFDLSKEVIHT